MAGSPQAGSTGSGGVAPIGEIPVALSDLRPGDNTLDLRMQAPAADVTESVANISLMLELETYP